MYKSNKEQSTCTNQIKYKVHVQINVYTNVPLTVHVLHLF